jgi:hypothetical protein
MLSHNRFQAMWHSKAEFDADAWAESTRILPYLVISYRYARSSSRPFVFFFSFECKGEAVKPPIVQSVQYR